MRERSRIFKEKVLKNIFMLMVSFGIILFTLIPTTVGHTNPDPVGSLTHDEILRSKAAFAVVDEEIARHLNLGALSEWDYQKLRGPVLLKIRTAIHFQLRDQFSRIVHTVDFDSQPGSPSQNLSVNQGNRPLGLHKKASEIIRDFIDQEHISVIIMSDAPVGLGETAAIRRLRGEVRYIYELINGASVSIPIKNLTSLIKLRFVREIWPNSKGKLTLFQSVPQIGADKVHDTPPRGFGITGMGVRVAVVDTGIDRTHSEFKDSNGKSRIVADRRWRLTFQPAKRDHGTHVAGIIGAAADGKKVTGVAPNVHLLDAETQNPFFYKDTSYGDAMDAIEWAVDNNADVINMSLGWDPWKYDSDGKQYGWAGGDPMSQLIDRVVDSGVVFVVSAGNEARRRASGNIASNSKPMFHEFYVDEAGDVEVVLLWDTLVNDLDLVILDSSKTQELYSSRADTSVFESVKFKSQNANIGYTIRVEAPFGIGSENQPYEVWVSDGSLFYQHDFDPTQTVGVPGYSEKAITVGAVAPNNDSAWYSSQGPSSPVAVNPNLVLNPSFIKPEIVAPGGQAIGKNTGIYSTEASPLGHEYGKRSGTSMAAPHVAGVAALILDAVGKNDRGEWNFNPDEVKSAIVRGAEGGVGSIPNMPDNIYGAGLVRADNIIFSDTVPAYGKLRFEIIPRLYRSNYGGYRLNADPYLVAAISWENPAHNLDLVLSDASNGRTLPMLSQTASNSAKIGGNEFILPDSEATYFLDVINRSQAAVTFTGAATHKIIEAPILAQNQPSDLIVESVTVDKSNLAPGENFTLSITVENQGPGQSSATTLHYYKWDPANEKWKRIPDKTSDVEPLSTNDTSSQSISLTAPNSDGTHYYSACVDEVTNENDTSNNCAKYSTITVEQPVQTSTDAPVFVYWADSGTGKIQRANLDGSNIQDIVTGLDDPYSIALDGTARKIYWTNYRRSKIQRANLDGSNIQDIVTRLGSPYGIALDVAAGKMYWTDEGPDKIQRANLDGSNIQDVFIVRGLGNPQSITLDVAAGKMYWTTAWTEKIQRANLDGTNVQNLVTPRLAGLGGPSDIAVDVAAEKMYWTNPFNRTIQRANLNGTNVETLIRGGNPYGIALDVAAGKMYWTNWHTDKIQRADLDGSNIEDFVTTGLVSPTGIALGIPTPKVPDLLVTALSTSKSSLAPSENFTLSATIENHGTGEASATTLRYLKWDGTTETWKRIPDTTSPVPSLSANSSITKGVTFTASNTTGKHFYRACVDAVSGEANSDTNCYESWVTITVQQPVVAEDVNGDGVVNILDLVLVDSHFGGTGENDADVNEDGIVNIADLLLVAKAFGNTAGAPSAQPVTLNTLTAERIQQWLTEARTFPNFPAYQRGIVVLEQLLVMLIPKETALLPNYPNPFNPETWIPYQLAEAAEVSLTIYAVDGTIVRTLVLGHQAAGIYQDRKRAAYWDGRNVQSEPVASGVYFYTLKAGDFTTTRKMLIRK